MYKVEKLRFTRGMSDGREKPDVEETNCLENVNPGTGGDGGAGGIKVLAV